MRGEGAAAAPAGRRMARRVRAAAATFGGKNWSVEVATAARAHIAPRGWDKVVL